MFKNLIAPSAVVAGLALAACGGHAAGGNVMPMAGNSVALPAPAHDMLMYATMPKATIGEELPKEGLGVVKSAKWKATMAGYTQQRYSQSLGFPPGTKITIRNLSGNVTHTLDVVKEISGPPAVYPKGVKLPVEKRGSGKLEAGFASGPIKPGHSVTITLGKAGIYLIGCAFHYGDGMHDVIVIAPHAAPGPQATAPPGGGGGGGSGSGSGSGW
ncbi:MAG: hypothetical protein WA814_04840 [Candidatus Baltobacteraceae bacterium]